MRLWAHQNTGLMQILSSLPGLNELQNLGIGSNLKEEYIQHESIHFRVLATGHDYQISHS